jgi:hypothetical protein
VRTILQEACAAEGVGARQADGLVEGLEADGALWHCRRSVQISAAGEAGCACSSSTAAEEGMALGSQAPLIARKRRAKGTCTWRGHSVGVRELGLWGVVRGAADQGVAQAHAVFKRL